MKTRLFISLFVSLLMACANEDLKPNSSSEKAPAKATLNENQVGMVLGELHGMFSVMLEDGKVIWAVPSVLPDYLHDDNTFFHTRPGTRVSLSYDVHPYCDDKGCVTPELHTFWYVFVKSYSIVENTAFIPEKDPITFEQIRNILSTGMTFNVTSVYSPDETKGYFNLTLDNAHYTLSLFPPDDKVVAGGTLSLTSNGTVIASQTEFNSTISSIESHHLLDGEYHYSYYLLEQQAEKIEGGISKKIRGTADVIHLWKEDNGILSLYELMSPVKWVE